MSSTETPEAIVSAPRAAQRARWVSSVLLLSLAVLAGCGLGLDNADRIARGETAFAAGKNAAAIIDAKHVLVQEPNNLAARLLLARAALASGDPQTAAIEFERSVTLGAAPDTVIGDLGKALLALGRYDEVLERITDDANAELAARTERLLLRASALVSKDKPEAARQAFASVLELDAENQWAAVGVVSTYRMEGELVRARELIDSIRVEHPDWSLATLASAELANQEGLPEQARELYLDVLAVTTVEEDGTLWWRAMAGLTASHIALGEYRDAEAALQKLATQTPNAPATQFYQAQIDLAYGRLSEAITRLQDILNRNPYDTRAALLAGNAHLKQGTLGQAEMHVSGVLAREPENPFARRLLAEVRLLQGQPDVAEQLLAPLLDGNIADSDLLRLALRINVANGDPVIGVDRYRQALTQAPANPALRLDLASAQLLLGQVDGAEKTLGALPGGSAAAELQGELLRVLALVRRGDMTSALDSATSLAAAWPESVAIHRTLGAIAIRADRLDIAKTGFETVRDLNPQDPSIYLQLARVALSDDNEDGARAYLDAGLTRLPDSVLLMMGMAEIEARVAQRVDSAINWLVRARDADPTSIPPRLALSDYHRSRGDVAKAIVFAEEALAINATSAAAKNSLGMAQLANGDASAAALNFADAVAIAAGNELYQTNLARAQIAAGDLLAAESTLARSEGSSLARSLLQISLTARNGDLAKASTDVQALVSRYPDEAAPLELAGDVLLAQGDAAAAAVRLADAYALDPELRLLQKATFARFRAGMPDADSLVREALNADPGAIELRRFLAQMYAAAGNEELAEGEYRRIVDADAADVTTLNNLAWLYFSRGDARAEQLARQAVELDPDSVEANDTLGWILVNAGQVQDGVTLLRRALSRGAQSPDIRYHLAEGLARSGDKRAALAQVNKALSTADLPFTARSDAKALLARLQAE